MPRARIPNASFIASAELPILPFLAPRVFAKPPPILRRSGRHYGRNSRVQQKKEEALNGQEQSGVSQCTANAQRDSKSSGLNSCLRLGQASVAAGLLRTSRPQWKPPSSSHISTSAGHRYADISAFARQHVTRHRTGTAIPHRVPSKTKRAPQRARTAKTARKSSTLGQRGIVSASRRAKALALEQERLANYISREPAYNAATALQSGRYRSLRRRVSNLQHWDVTTVDLRRLLSGSSRKPSLIRSFAALDRRIYNSVGRYTHKIVIKHHPRCVRWSAQLFRDDGKHDLQQVWRNWLEFDIGTRKAAFLSLLIYLLDRKPGRAMQFIRVLANDPVLRGMKNEAIADALEHLSRLHSRGAYAANEDWSSDPLADKRNFVPAFVHIYRDTLYKDKRVCSQDLLYNMVNLVDAEDLKKLFDCLVDSHTYLGFDTLLHYANAFAEAGEFQYALRCLDELKAKNSASGWEGVADRRRLRWSCALILRKSMSKGEKYHETPGIVAAIVGLGIKFDILLYNVVMHNAMEAGDYATAFKVYNALEGNELKADKYTYSILLHGCACQSNLAMFSHFAEHCANVAEETKDPWLATDYLYYLYVRHQNTQDKVHNGALLRQAYLRFFSIKPLELLGNRLTGAIRVSLDKHLFSLDSTVLEPPPIALYIMLQTEIQLALATSNAKVLNLYQRFRLLGSQDSHPVVTALAREPTIWNAFLLAFCQKQQFASASQLIKDMTDDGPLPNVYSWNIFMQAFFKTRQVQAAERVFDIMRSRGIDPDQFTHGVLLRGFAKAQHVERIGEIMQHVDTEQEMDPDLLRALAQVMNRNKLMLTLEKSRVHKQVKAQEEAAKEAAKEEERWATPHFTPMISEASQPGLVKTSSEPRSDLDVTSHLSDLKHLELAQELEPEDFKAQLQTKKRQDSNGQLPVGEPRLSPVPTPPEDYLQKPFDPEVAYKKLQEELSIDSPPIPLDPANGNPEPVPNPLNSFGASLGFKSMLQSNNAVPQVSEAIPKFKIQKIIHFAKRKQRSGDK